MKEPSAAYGLRVVVEQMPDGKWYATRWEGGLSKAGSGRVATIEEAIHLVEPLGGWPDADA